MPEPLLVRPNIVGSHTAEIREYGRAAIINESTYAIGSGDGIERFDLELIRKRFLGRHKGIQGAFNLLEDQLETGEAIVLGVTGQNSNYTAAYRVRLDGHYLKVIERLPVRKLTKIEDAEFEASESDQSDGENWTTEELEAAVRAYVDMKLKADKGESFTKISYYRALSDKYRRSEKSYEYRMQNISYVYSLLGRRWLDGLKPAKNIGSRVAGIIEGQIAAIEGSEHAPVVAFELEVDACSKAALAAQPAGNSEPQKITSQTAQFVRDPAIVAWVLKNADGVCEKCVQNAPFKKANGKPYLEVHHVRRLADGGSDRIENAIAACPNCHREIHYGADQSSMIAALYDKIDRLDPE